MLKIGSAFSERQSIPALTGLSLSSSFLSFQDLTTTGSTTPDNGMPMDYKSYLLAASPPGFDLNYAVRQHLGVANYTGKIRPSPVALVTESENGGHGNALSRQKKHTHSCLSKLSRCRHGFHQYNGTGRDGDVDNSAFSNGVSNPTDEDVSDLATSVQFDLDLEDETEGKLDTASGSVRSTESDSLRKQTMGKKKVSFADDFGMSLVYVKIMTDSSDTPPRLCRQILSSLTQGASAAVTVTPPLVLTFPQPASNYLEFRNRVQRDSVSLENVIVNNYNLLGTIKVKNITFSKNVFVRCTFDDWKTTRDIPAVFVRTCKTSSSEDTFSFEINVPTTMKTHGQVQFAVCYEAEGAQYWDNNNGANYKVITADWKSGASSNSLSTVNAESDPTTFAAWNHIDEQIPYW